MTLISAKEEPKQKAPKEEKEKAHPWAPPPQHNFLKNWRRNLALRKQQQEALSGEQSGPGSRRASSTTEAPVLGFSVAPPAGAWVQAGRICAIHSPVFIAVSGS